MPPKNPSPKAKAKDASPKPEPKNAAPKAEPKTASPKTEAKPRPEGKTASPKTDSKKSPKPEPKTVSPKTEAQTAPKAEPKAVAKAVAKSAPKVAAKADAKKAPKKSPAPTATGRVDKKKKSARKTRNPLLARGIHKYSRSAKYHRSGVWANKNWKKTEKKTGQNSSVKTKQFGGGWRVIRQKEPRFYPADHVPHPLNYNRTHHNPSALRPSITPGTILILLAGRFRGRRVVFLKQLKSGLLLVTGPYLINGVPLRRVNQAYVIATSTKVDVSGLNVNKYTDKYFRRPKEQKKKKTEATLFETEKKEKVIKPERKADQKAVDTELVTRIKKVPYLTAYLVNKFTLTQKLHPHEVKF